MKGNAVMLDDAWLERRYYGGDLPAAAEQALHEAARDWHDEAAAEAHIRTALRLAPDHLAVQIGAYKFFLYRHRLAEALPHAEACLAETLRRNDLPADWRAVRPDQAAFATLEPAPRMVLFALVARGYVLARVGRAAESRETLSKVAELDPDDRMGARRLLAVLDRGGRDEEDEA
jgi:tetratricopeptide (TPR) repeat protein